MRTTRSPWQPRLSKRVSSIEMVAERDGSIILSFWLRTTNENGTWPTFSAPIRRNVSPSSVERITRAVEWEHCNGEGEVHALAFRDAFGWKWIRSHHILCNNCVYRAFQIAADEICGPRTVEEIIFGGDDCNGARCELKSKGDSE